MITAARGTREPDARHALIDAAIEARTRLTGPWFRAEAARIARLCYEVARRLDRGGRLIAIGDTAAARSDVWHVTVEFVHPVIVGKRALPALGLCGGDSNDSLAADVALIAEPNDFVMAFGDSPAITRAIIAARERGCSTVAFAPVGAEWLFLPPPDDPFIAQELVETLYHVVWELVHVFFEHRGLLRETTERGSRGGAAGFLYPFLDDDETNLDSVLNDVAASVVMKADEVSVLRERLDRDALTAAAGSLRSAFSAGGRLLVFGNGGSATDAMDAVADYRSPPTVGTRWTNSGVQLGTDQGTVAWPRRPAIDLTEDPAILTALANDVGPEVLFSRQIIAHGRAGDVAMAFSTSGGSRNIVHALAEARRRGLATIAFVGYDGGPIAADRLADHVVVTASQHIPRIQEAQAAAHHILRELVEAE